MFFFGCLSVVEGCSLSPEWPEQGDDGRAHGTTPVKPIYRPFPCSPKSVSMCKVCGVTGIFTSSLCLSSRSQAGSVDKLVPLESGTTA